jgi:hypothetical protein
MKKKKFIFDQRKFDLFTKGKPCVPGRIRNLSKEEGESMMERLAELRKEGKILFSERTYSLTEHEYYDRLINENIEIENYEECARLLKLKNETPYSEERTRFISETF